MPHALLPTHLVVSSEVLIRPCSTQTCLLGFFKGKDMFATKPPDTGQAAFLRKPPPPPPPPSRTCVDDGHRQPTWHLCTNQKVSISQAHTCAGACGLVIKVQAGFSSLILSAGFVLGCEVHSCIWWACCNYNFNTRALSFMYYKNWVLIS